MGCQLRPPDAMPLLTYNLFGTSGHQQLNFDGFIYNNHAGHLIPCHSQRLYGGWVKIPVLCFRSFDIWYSFVELKTTTNKQK